MKIEIELEIPKGSKKTIHEIEVADDSSDREIDEAVYEYVDGLIFWTWQKKDDNYWNDVFNYWNDVLRPDTDEAV